MHYNSPCDARQWWCGRALIVVGVGLRALDAGAKATTNQELPIAVNAPLSSLGQDPSILLPSSCRLHHGTFTALGLFKGGFVRVRARVPLHGLTIK